MSARAVLKAYAARSETEANAREAHAGNYLVWRCRWFQHGFGHYDQMDRFQHVALWHIALTNYTHG